jgi:hypothetical protein
VAVRPDLLRLNLKDYALPHEVWEKLAEVDPYFHTQIETEGVEKVVEELWPGGVWSDGRNYPRGAFKVQKKVTLPAGKQSALAPWLDAGVAAGLAKAANSKAPVVRADWWLVQTSQQVVRQGTGYYDFLRVKNRDDFWKLVRLDKKAAEEAQREVRAIVDDSGVALNNRQVVRLGTLLGGYWVTLDSKRSTGKNNAVRNLNGDYKHDAEEVYAALPNGLFALFAGDANGVRADSVPDDIASSGVAPGNDRRIHLHSCVTCHVEGIRPIDDWARSVYTGDVALAGPDAEKIRRLRRLYLSDLERWVRRDRADYAEALLKISGLKPAEMAKLFGHLHASYAEARLGREQAAAELGTNPAHLLASLKSIAGKAGSIDPLVSGYLKEPPRRLRREHFEEAYPLLQQYLRGYTP